jgi:fermentation-respiration switch protein FrsA (DUF1100 family)
MYKTGLVKYAPILLLYFFVSACDNSVAPPMEPEVQERGYVFSLSKTATFTPGQIDQVLTFYGIDHNLEFSYTVDVYKVEYQTVTAAEKPVHASGALMIPATDEPVPLLSIQHGTVTGRNEVASMNPLNSVEGVVGVMTASLGYLTNVPDYTGFGVSNMLHPYVHARSLALAVIDMLRATVRHAGTASIDLSGRVYLSGYSEGGYATLATQKEIEAAYADEFQLTAVAPMAGPYDLLGTFAHVLEQQTYDNPAYIAFLLTAYNDVYQWNRLDELFQAPYASMMPGLFDGSKSYGDINRQLPAELRTLLKPEFIDAYLAGDETEILAAAAENTLLDWAPAAPIRFFHGDADEAVPYDNALTALENLGGLSTSGVELITIAGGTHESAGIPAILGMIDWFQEIESTTAKRGMFVIE